VTGLTGSHFAALPADVAPETRRYYQQLTRFSAAFAFLADVSMLVMGGDLKRKEKALGAHGRHPVADVPVPRPRSSATRPKAARRPTRR
jgi:hypothetical protein